MSDDEMDSTNPDGITGPPTLNRTPSSASMGLSLNLNASATAPNGTPSSHDRRAPRFSWTPAYEATFFRSLCESVQLGLRENSSFKAEAWERAMHALQAAHDAHPAKSHLINKSDNARKRFRLWRGLREDPNFVYDSEARTVSASEEAWKSHIEREPLSRALRGRPFDHEEFMEVLYPDVIGSGGAPKRVMKPRRRTDGTLVDDSDMPGTGIINLQHQNSTGSTGSSGLTPGSVATPSSAGGAGSGMLQPGSMDGFAQRPPLQQTPSGSSTGSLQSNRSQTSSVGPGVTGGLPMPTYNNMGAPTVVNGAAGLTPPDEVGSAGGSGVMGGAAGRKRTYQQGGGLPSDIGQMHAPPPTLAEKRRRTSSQGGAVGQQTPLRQQSGPHVPGVLHLNNPSINLNNAAIPVPGSHVHQSHGHSHSSSINEPHDQQSQHQYHGQSNTEHSSVSHALDKKSQSITHWCEQAVEIFFRDFAEEDVDTQCRVAEDVLSVEGKAMVFVKMPVRVRQHWVRRLREA